MTAISIASLLQRVVNVRDYGATPAGGAHVFEQVAACGVSSPV